MWKQNCGSAALTLVGRAGAPVKRIAAPDTPVPFSPPLEKAFIPQVEGVAKELKELIEY